MPETNVTVANSLMMLPDPKPGSVRELQNIRDSAHPFTVPVVYLWLCSQYVTKKGKQDLAACELASMHQPVDISYLE